MVLLENKSVSYFVSIVLVWGTQVYLLVDVRAVRQKDAMQDEVVSRSVVRHTTSYSAVGVHF